MPRRRCWTVCEARSQSQKTAAGSAGTDPCGLTASAAAAVVSRCRTASLHISIGGDDTSSADNNLVLSPVSSPSFSFDSVRDMFAAMGSPSKDSTMTMLKSPQTGNFPLDDGFTGVNARVSVLSPTTKRPRKSTNASSASSGSNTSAVSNCSSSSTSRASSRTSSRRYTSILSRCLPRNLKSSTATSGSNNRDHYHEVTSESPSYRATDTTLTTCSALASTSPAAARKRFGTVLLNDDQPQDLHHLFRDEAEYSDYLSALVTGAHSQMDAVVFYELEVHLSQMQWKLYRRFSEFRTLRQNLIKHFSRRLRHQQEANTSALSPKCEICAHMLAAIEQMAFPSRQQTHRHWHKLFKSSSSSSSSEADNVDSPTAATARFSTEAVIADRKAKFGEFAALCLRTIRGLRQHGKVMEDSSACEIGTALRLIEEFFGLSFTRYLRFLSERGIVGDTVSSNNSSKGTKQKQTSGSAFTTGNRRRLTAVI
ncbi:Phox homologous domain [Globisporangium polare]